MRNLKKILALVLALVMSFSLMATANAFTDDKDIDATYDEAVTVLSNLKVFQGYENGSFQPKGEITRAEVAAIIYRIVTGDVNDAQVAIYKDYNKFNDVKSTSWYAGYVNYCANAEYIKGYDAKTFGPNDKVTGYQALAMILRAVGYDKNGEFTGAGWQVQVASVAKSLHITDNVTAGTLGGSAPREVVAELLFRSILVPQVTYSAAFGYQNIGLTTGAIANTNNIINSAWLVHNDSIGAETFGLQMVSGEISAVGRTAGTTTLVDRSAAANGTLLNPVTVTNTDTPWTDIGYGAYVYTVPTAGSKTREAVSDVVVTGQSLLATTDGTEYGFGPSDANVVVEDGAHLYYNGEYIGNILIGANGAITNPSNGKIKKFLQDKDGIVGVKVDYIDNDNGGRAEVVAVTEYSVASVTGITNATNIGSNAIVENSTYIIEHSATEGAPNREAARVADSKLVASEELAVGDLVTYVEYPGSFKGENAATAGDYYVTKAPVTTDKYTQINYATTSRNDVSYVIGETTYVVSEVNNTCYNGAVSYLNARANNTYTNVGNTVDVYTDPYGHILHVNTTNVAKDYLYVIRNDHSSAVSGTAYATVAYPDGSIENVYVTKGTLEVLNNIAENVYTYSASGNNLRISNTPVCTDYNVEL